MTTAIASVAETSPPNLTEKLSGEHTGGRYSICEIILRPREGVGPYAHPQRSVWFYVLKGEFLFQVDGKRHLFRAGASLRIPPGSVHFFVNCGRTAGTLLAMTDPAAAPKKNPSAPPGSAW